MDDATAAKVLNITMDEMATIAQCEDIHGIVYDGGEITDEQRNTLKAGLDIASKSESIGLLIAAVYWSKYV